MSAHASSGRLTIRTDWYRPHVSPWRRASAQAARAFAAVPPRYMAHALVLGIAAAGALAAALT